MQNKKRLHKHLLMIYIIYCLLYTSDAADD